MATLGVGPALAQDAAGELGEIREMVLYARYAEAIAKAQQFLQRQDLRATDRNAGLEALAIAQVANRRERDARTTLAELYRRDPGHRLSDPDASPQIQSAFARARENASAPVTVELQHDATGELARREAPEVVVAIGEGADAVAEVRLQYRDSPESRFQTVVMDYGSDGVARASIPLAGGRDAYTIEYYVTALAPSLTTLGTVGTETEPLELAVPEAEVQRSVAIGTIGVAGTGDDRRDDDGGGVLSKWWFWTAVVVVVGAGVATGVILASQSGTAPEGTLGTVTLLR